MMPAFTMHYQPMLDFASPLAVRSFEALARPCHRYSAAHVLRQACAQAKRWHGITIAANFTPTDFSAPAFAADVIACVAENDLAPTLLELEMVEWEPIDGSRLHAVNDTIDQLRAAGFSVAMDDYGAGYSTDSRLATFAWSKLKIDRLTMLAAIADPAADLRLRGVVRNMRACGVEVVAEGIEGDAMLRYARTIGCSGAQGFHIGRPASAAAWEARRPGLVRLPGQLARVS
jgi:EAL domain-containing protein (putative c-di-GMP-specific phosphodiesterase class I)